MKRVRIVLGSLAIAALLATTSLAVKRYTARKLIGPFRIGFFRSGVEHFPGPDGKPRGAAVDLLNEAARRRGIKLEWVYSPEGTDAALESGRVDLWPNAGDVPERKGRIYISKGWNRVKYGFLSRDDRPVTA